MQNSNPYTAVNSLSGGYPAEEADRVEQQVYPDKTVPGELSYYSKREKQKACTEVLLLYEAIPQKEKDMIPEWFIESLRRYYNLFAVPRTDPHEILKYIRGLSSLLAIVMCYFAHEETIEGVKSYITRHSIALLNETLSYRKESGNQKAS